MNIIKKNNASLFLIFNAVLWGSSYVWSKMLLEYLSRFSILFLCALGGVVSTTVIFYSSIKKISTYAIISSVVVSLFSIASNTFFMLALEHTGSSNTAFIVQMSVIITPLLMAVLDKKLPQKKAVFTAAIALVGLFLLTCDLESLKFKIGDLFALGNAVFFSLFLVGTNIVSRKIDSAQFTFVHHITNTIAFFAMAGLMERQQIHFNKLLSWLFIVLISASIFISVATVLIQSVALKHVRPEKAALLYTFEPVATLVLAFIFIGERLKGIEAAAGCVLILLAVCCSNYNTESQQGRFDMETSRKPVLE